MPFASFQSTTLENLRYNSMSKKKSLLTKINYKYLLTCHVGREVIAACFIEALKRIKFAQARAIPLASGSEPGCKVTTITFLNDYVAARYSKFNLFIYVILYHISSLKKIATREQFVPHIISFLPLRRLHSEYLHLLFIGCKCVQCFGLQSGFLLVTVLLPKNLFPLFLSNMCFVIHQIITRGMKVHKMGVHIFLFAKGLLDKYYLIIIAVVA